MKKIILTFSLLIVQFGFSQELQKVEKLTSLCKVWGFLKYYHPNVAKGDFNWDEQLLNILPKIQNCETKEELSQIYINWIISLGEIKTCRSCNETSKKEYFNNNFDLTWSQNNNIFTKELRDKIKFIETNRFQGTNYYVKESIVENIDVTNEIEYKNFEFPDEENRLLSIFKFWNIVEYFYPYKYLTTQKWDAVLTEMIPKFQFANNKQEYHLAMLELSIKIDDTHSDLITDETYNYFGKKWIPADFKIIDNKVILTSIINDSLAKQNDLRIGDIVEKVNDKKISQIITENLKYVSGSNYNTKLRNFNYVIFNGSTDSVSVTIKRDANVFTKNIGRYFYKKLNRNKKIEDKYKIIGQNIGYVNMGIIEASDISKMFKEFKNKKAIIFDIRNYPKGTYHAISKYLNDSSKVFVKIIRPDLSYPGKFYWREGFKCGGNNKDNYKGKVILIVNEQTQSHGEYTAMCLQTANNVTTIGSQTAGADGSTTPIEFVGGYKLKLTGLGIFYPDNTETQRKGIKIDIEIKPTIKGIQEGKDEVLEKAIELIETGK